MVHHPHNEMSQLSNEPMSQGNSKRKFGSHLHCNARSAVQVLGNWQIGSLQSGSVSIEMVFFLLIFVVAFFGAIEMAREVSVKHALDVGTYRAARYLSIVPNDQLTARNMIQNELNANVLGGAGSVVVTVDMPSPSFQTVFSVTADVPYQPVIPLMVFAPKTLRVIHSQSIEAYP
jgi:hypothetical protein